MPPRGSEFLPIRQQKDNQRIPNGQQFKNNGNGNRNPQSEQSGDEYTARKHSKDSNRLSIGSFISDIDQKDQSEFIKVGAKQKKTIQDLIETDTDGERDMVELKKLQDE